MLTSQLTILNFGNIWFSLGESSSHGSKSLPIKNFCNKVHAFGQVVIEGFVNDMVQIFNSEISIDISNRFALRLTLRRHMILEQASLVLFKCSVFIFLLLELGFQVVDFEILLLNLILRFCKIIRHSFRITKRCLVLLQRLKLILLLIQQVGFLSGDV